MRITTDIRDDVAVLTMSGRLMNGPDVAPFHEKIKALAEEGIVNVVVDFSKVRWFGSAMLGVMTASYTTLRNAGGELRLTGVLDNRKIHGILVVTRLNSIFRTLETVDRAVASFKTQPPEPIESSRTEG